MEAYQIQTNPVNVTETQCFHCGGSLPKKFIQHDSHAFCCKGCVSVYKIIKTSGLENIYTNNAFGKFSKPADDEVLLEFDFLENPNIEEKIISFKEKNICKVVLYAPDIHCASCIWLLEHLPKLHPGIIQSQVNFHSKKISILFDNTKLDLKHLALLLTQIGYKPCFTFEKKEAAPQNKKLLMQLGVAGFVFGNVMLLSFPDYLNQLSTLEAAHANLFHYVSFILTIPLMVFSAQPYLQVLWNGLKNRHLNMDIPIGIGIITLFLRSTYDVFVLHESGYFDSLSGFIFFLLVGKWYQQKTFQFLNFDQSFRSFFPMSVLKIENLNEVVKDIQDIKENDIVKLRNGELIPFDGILLSPYAEIDYSFVTGESTTFQKQKGDLIYTGGKLQGQKILLQVKKPFDQPYFMQLWNENTSRKEWAFKKISSFLGKFITIIVLLTALLTFFYWKEAGMQTTLKHVTSVLIIGCSCAFALSAPFLSGNVSRILAKQGFFIKNADSIMTLAKARHIVLDKTGTLTEKEYLAHWYSEKELSIHECNCLYALFQNSFHPLSKKIADTLKKQITEYYECEDYKEYPGQGIEGLVCGMHIRAGSKEWLNIKTSTTFTDSTVFVEINGIPRGYFLMQHSIRDGLERLNILTKKGYILHILTGDHPQKAHTLQNIFSDSIYIFANQKPEDKKIYIEQLQKNNEIVVMIGDGLNDIPALKTSDFGISITDNNAYFAPSGDAIFNGNRLHILPEIIKFAKISYQLLIVSYIYAFLYNSIGLTLASMGYLNPLVAAIFMPASSISVVLFAVFSTNYMAKKLNLIQR